VKCELRVPFYLLQLMVHSWKQVVKPQWHGKGHQAWMRSSRRRI